MSIIAETAKGFPEYPGDGADFLSTARDLAAWDRDVSALGIVMLHESYGVWPVASEFEAAEPLRFIRSDGSTGSIVAF
jgi:hypothetical protein